MSLRRMGRRRLATALLAGLAVAAVGYAAEAASPSGRSPGRSALGPEPVTVLVEVRHSRFILEPVTVRAGTEVRFVVVNDDPIDHELVVGDPGVHARHADGTEPSHGDVAGEVSVAAEEVATTSYRFDHPGLVRIACHLPGHVEYGMEDVVEVIG